MPRDAASRKKAYSLGRKGEFLAAFYLRLKGYQILTRRYKTPVGEVDLIVRKKNTIAFIEVKARARYEDGVEAITYKQQRRCIRAAKYFIATRPEFSEFDLRFDAIIVLPGLSLKHLKGAWGEDNF